MRQVWISLMLCACTAGVAACDSSTPPSRPLARSASPGQAPAGTAASKVQAHPVKVSVATAPATPEAQARDPSAAASWRDEPLTAPLLASALAMVMIALRRGGH